MTEKAPDAYRTISEVAADLDLPQHVLRFWETRFGQIKPLKRAGGRRYYRPDDVALLRGIRELLYGRGYTIRGVQKILREQGVRRVQDIGAGAPVETPPDQPDVAEAPADERMSADGERPVTGIAGGVAHAVPAPAPDFAPKLARIAAELAECRRLIASARAH